MESRYSQFCHTLSRPLSILSVNIRQFYFNRQIYIKKSNLDMFVSTVFVNESQELGIALSYDSWNYHIVNQAPLSRHDLENLYELLIVHTPYGDKIGVLNFLKNVAGPHPWLQRKLRDAYISKQNFLRERRIKQRKHEEAQRQWFAEGGQQKAYRKKYPFGSQHQWMVQKIRKITGMDVDDGLPIIGCEEEVVLGTTIKQQIRKRVHTLPLFVCENRLPKPIKVRSIMLLFKLRALCRQLREEHISYAQLMKDTAPLCTEKYTKVEAEMEEPHHTDAASTTTSGNVVLSEIQPSPPAVAATHDNFMWNKMSSTELNTSYEYLMNRYTLMSTFEWKTTHARNFKLSKRDLPYDLIDGISAGTMPIFLPFKIFRYFRSDIDIKIHLNSNKFQVGQLQVAWQYMEKFLEYGHTDNIYGASQLPHVLISAGSSNEVTLVIPYKFINPYMHTIQRRNGLDCLYLGTITIRVLSPLVVSSTGPTSCHGSVFARFPNAIFTGMRDGSIVEPEMMSAALAMGAMKVIDSAIGDRNCDNKISGNVPSYLVPTGSHSWSLGSGVVEPLHNLRLTNNTSGVGREGIDVSETDISVPCRTFGLYTVLQWSRAANEKNVNGYILFEVDAHPQLDKAYFNKFDEANAMPMYNVPPVTVVSSLYQQWRGSLEFRFDFICSQFHTGRVLVAYVPGIYSSGKNKLVSIAQARNCPHAIFSLQDSNTFTFVVPFISDRPWWYRKYTGGQRRKEESAPSRVYMYVLNPLVTMESVSDIIEIAVYVRAGPDFEVSTPVQPAIGLSYNAFNYIKISEKAKALDSRSPWRVTFWGGFDKDRCVAYYGNDVTGSACMMYDPQTRLAYKEYVYFKCDDLPSAPSMYVKNEDDKLELRQVEFLVLYPQDNWVMGIPFPKGGESLAKQCAAAILKKSSKAEIIKCCMPFQKDGGSQSKGNPLYSPIKVKVKINDYVVVDAENGEDRYESGTMLSPTGSLPSTSFGNFTFGENFKDMKDLMRRYQLYLQKFLSIGKDTQVYGEACIQFPAIPSGLTLDTSDRDNQIWNQLRDGAIPIICSGYIFFRGSLRYRIMCSSDNIQMNGAKVWVQHHPDQPANHGYTYTLAPQMELGDKYQNHNYGFYIQPMSVNGIIEVEVPFYQQGMYGIASRISGGHFAVGSGEDDILDYIGLGDIVIGAAVGKLDVVTEVGLQVYYSVGDDFSLSCFRGFPAVVFCDQVFEKVQPQMYSWSTSILSGFLGGAAGNVVKQGITKAVVNGVAAEVKEQLEPQINNLTDAVLSTANTIKTEFNHNIQISTLSSALGNLLHILANPTPSTVAISVCNIIGTFLMNSIDALLKLKDILGTFFLKYWSTFTGANVDENVIVQPEMDGEYWFESPELKQMLALIFTAIAALIGYSGSAPNSYFNCMRNLTITASLSNNIIAFLKNISEVIGMMFKFCLGILYPESRYEMLLEDAAPDVVKWIKEVEYLKDARIKQRLTYDRQLMDRVFDAATYGSLLITNNIHQHNPAGKVLWDLYKEICKLRNDMIERGAHPDVRFECFPLYVSGPAGIGKSYMATELSTTLLEAIHYQSRGTPIYYISPGLKHWSGVQNPAVLVSDDIFQVKGQLREEELATLFKICSSSVLNPPMAAVEDKEKRLNPLIYLMFCNSSFPDLSGVMTCADAVYRRRKFLIEADFTEEIRNEFGNILDASQLPRARLQNFGHLRFRIARDPRNAQTEYSPWMTYNDLLPIIRDAFVIHYQHERDNFVRRMRNMYRLDPNFAHLDLFDEIPVLAEQVSLAEQRRIFTEAIREEMADLEDPFREEEPFIQKCIRRLEHAWKYRFQGANDVTEEPVNSTEFAGNVDDDFKMVLYNTSGMDDDDIEALEWNDVLKESKIYLKNRIIDFRKRSDTMRKINEIRTPDDPSCSWMSDAYVLSAHDALTRSMVLLNFTKSFATQVASQLNLGNVSPRAIVRFAMMTVVLGVMDEGHVTRMKAVKMGPYIPFKYFCLDRFDISPAFEIPLSYDDPLFKRGHVVHTMEDIKDLLLVYLQNYYTLGNNEIGTLLTDPERLKRKLENLEPTQLLFKIILFAFRDNQQVLETMADETKRQELANMMGKPEYKQQLIDFYTEYIRYLRLLTGEPRGCKCYRIYNMMIKDMQNVYWKPETKSFVYRNYIGLKETYPECDHEYGPVQNSYFRALFGLYYNHIHANDIQIGAVVRYDRVNNCFDDARVKEGLTYFQKFKGNVKYYWHTKIGPFLGEVLTFVLELIPTVLVYLAMLVTICGVIYGASKVNDMVSSVFTTRTYSDPHFETQGHNYFKFDRAQPQAHQNPTPAAKTFAKESANQANLALHKKVTNNTVILHVTFVEEERRFVRSGRCLMLAGRRMLVLRHYMEEFSDVYRKHPNITFTLYFNVGGRSTNAVIYPEDLFKSILWAQVKGNYMKSNFGVCELPKYIPMFKNILPCLVTKSMHANLTSIADFICVGGENKFDMTVKPKTNYTVGASDITTEVIMDSIYSYNNQGKGLCGSVLICNSINSGSGGIFAMHVAGSCSTGEGVAEPIYREMFEEALLVLKPEPEVVEMPLVDLAEQDFELDTNLLMYGCVPRTFAHRESGETKIIPSKIHGIVYPVCTEPNPLRPGDIRQPPGSHPLRDGCNKHGSGAIVPFHPKIVEKSVEHLSMRHNQIIKSVRMKVEPLSDQDLTCGNSDIPYFEALNWKSSEGFPLRALRPSDAHDKRWLFDLEEKTEGYKLLGYNKLLKQQIQARDKCFQEWKKPPTVYEDCLKDARLPKEKCKIPGKTRVFSVAPVACTLDVKKYMGDYCAAFKNSRIVNSSGIGINPDSLEWTTLVTYLWEVGNKIITLDYSNFGPTLMSQIVAGAADVISNWHEYNNVTEEHLRRVRWLLDCDLINPVHLASNVIYQTINGISSGSPVTGELNSLCNMLYVYSIWQDVMQNLCPQYSDPYYFDMYCRFVVYGDDLIMSVNDEVIPYFNAITIRDHFIKHGITVTSAQKDDEMKPFDFIQNSTFLKRSFKEHPTRMYLWLAPVELNSVTECLNWIHKSPNEDDATIQNCNSALDLAYGHGPNFYTKFGIDIYRALSDVQLTINVKSWYLRDNEIFGATDWDEKQNLRKILYPWILNKDN